VYRRWKNKMDKEMVVLAQLQKRRANPEEGGSLNEEEANRLKKLEDDAALVEVAKMAQAELCKA